LGLDELAARDEYRTNAGRVRHREAVEGAIAAATRARPTAHWLARLHERGLLAAPGRRVGEAVGDPATPELGLFVELDGFAGVVSPRLDNAPAPPGAQRVPALGEDTADVLRETLGLGDDAIADLARRGIVTLRAP